MNHYVNSFVGWFIGVWERATEGARNKFTKSGDRCCTGAIRLNMRRIRYEILERQRLRATDYWPQEHRTKKKNAYLHVGEPPSRNRSDSSASGNLMCLGRDRWR